MRKTLKLSLTLVLALAMLFAVAVIASAETEPTASGDWSRRDSDSITWEYFADTQTLVIGGKGQMADAANANNTPWYTYRATITNLVIEEGVTRIGKNAFNNLTKVKVVTLPDSVTTLAKYSFSRMTGLTDLYIGTGLTTIASDAFAAYSTSCNVHVKDLATWCSIDFQSANANPMSMGKKAIYVGDELIENLVFPANVTKISKYAFKNCRSITSVTFHDGITDVATQAFGGCTKLTKVTVDNAVIKFGNYVFRNCTTLVNTYVNNLDTWGKCTFPTANSTPLGSGANRSCMWVNGLKYAKTYTSEGGREYDTDAATTLVIPDGVTTLNTNAFRQRTRNLTAVYIPASVTTIAGTKSTDGAFAYSGVNRKLTIYGEAGSAAETFANKVSGYTFVATTFDKVTAITVDTDDTTINLGETLTANVTVAPATVTTTPIWKSSDLSVARVSNGVVTAVGAGQATITASTIDGTVSDSFVVTVPGIPVTGITLDPTEATLELGRSLKINATVTPADATDVVITWTTSAKSVATVKNGVVTPVGGGQATITATVGEFSATCVVTVEVPVIEVTGITLDTTAAVLEPAQTLQLNATVTPADATDATVTWTTSNGSVATVVDGLVTAVADGEAVITAKAGNFEATCTIKVETPEVEYVAVEEIFLADEELEVAIGDVYNFEVIFNPEEATDKSLYWESSDEDVAIIEDGKLTALAEGFTIITVISLDNEDAYAECLVTVSAPVAVDGVTLNKTSASVLVGDTVELVATVTPNNAANKNVSWTTSNEAVATVDENGVVTTVGAGVATITVTTADGEFTATCKVIVSAGNELPALPWNN